MTAPPTHDPDSAPSELDEALHAAAGAAQRGDKQAACAALFAAEKALGSGPHPLRREIRAAACAVDISKWALAQARVGTVLSRRADSRRT